MAITIQGVKIKNVTIEFGGDVTKLEGDYELLSNTGVVLAKQGFNGYNDLKVGLSPAADAKLREAIAELTSNINRALGVE